jgi:hypothetical protein
VSVAGAAKEAAVETLVVRVEEAAKEATATQESVTPSSEELERQIRNALRELAADSQMLLSRIDRVERALLDRGWRTDVIDVRLARYAVRSQAEPTSAAMDIAARGSYREALERIAVISQKLGEVRVTLTEAEIKLVQAAQQEQEEREAKARVVEEEAAEQVEENNDGVPVKQETDAEAPVSKSSPP